MASSASSPSITSNVTSITTSPSSSSVSSSSGRHKLHSLKHVQRKESGSGRSVNQPESIEWYSSYKAKVGDKRTSPLLTTTPASIPTLIDEQIANVRGKILK